jgi:hypothetical protein
MKSCIERAEKMLEEEENNASSRSRRAVAKEVCRLLDSGKLEEDLDDQVVDLEYLVSRLEVRDGDDNPSMVEKWNYWLGMMTSFSENKMDYTIYQI